MNIATVMIGFIAIIFGLTTIVLRGASDDIQKKWLSKKFAMMERFGDGAGNYLHILAYSIMPIITGGIFLHSGLNGKSIFN